MHKYNPFSKLNISTNDIFDIKKLATLSKLTHPTKIIKQNSQLSCLYFALCPTRVICHSQIKMCFSNFSVQFHNKKNPHLSCIHLSLSNHTWSGNQKRTERNLTLEVVCWQVNQPNCIKQRRSYLGCRQSEQEKRCFPDEFCVLDEDGFMEVVNQRKRWRYESMTDEICSKTDLNKVQI